MFFAGHLLDTKDPEFTRRLLEAFEASPRTPIKKHGRYVWVKNELAARGIDVTAETVRRWFTGMAVPRPEAMAALASVIGVAPTWLAEGGGEGAPATLEVAASVVNATIASAAQSWLISRFAFIGVSARAQGLSEIVLRLGMGREITLAVEPAELIRNRVKVRIPAPSGLVSGQLPVVVVVINGGEEPEIIFLPASVAAAIGPSVHEWAYTKLALFIPSPATGQEVKITGFFDVADILASL